MPSAGWIGWIALLLVACSSDDGAPLDAGVGMPALPSSAISVRSSTGQPQAPVLDCSKTPDATATAPVLVNGILAEPDGTPIPGARLYAYADEGGFILATDDEGRFTLTLRVGTPNRTHWLITDTDQSRFVDTYQMNVEIDVTLAVVEVTITLPTVSSLTASALPALIGVSRTEGLGLLAGQVSDCDGRPIEHTLATMTRVPVLDASYDDIDRLDGSWVYYFIGGATPVPVRLSQQSTTSDNGMFVIIEIPPTSESFVQTWGYLTDDDIDRGAAGLALLSETPVPTVADSVVSVHATARLSP